MKKGYRFVYETAAYQKRQIANMPWSPEQIQQAQNKVNKYIKCFDQGLCTAQECIEKIFEQ